MNFRISIVINSLLSLVLLPFVANAAVLEEVVVTAQKREQNVQDVGIAISAFTGDQMRTLGYSNAQQITALAPGVSTVQPNGEANYGLAIRGAANSDFVANQESPVSLYVDEVYISQMSGAGFALFDLDRVEILRGPQGTLFGRNATGGLAHFVTRKPEHEFGGYGQVTVGEHDQVKFEGAIGGGLSETVVARASISTHHNSGYVTNRLDTSNDLNNANDYAGRVQLLFTPNNDVEFLINARYSLQQIRTGFFNNVDGSFDPATGLGFKTPGTGNFNGYSDQDGDVFAGDYDRLGFNDLETYGFSGTLKWQLSNGMELTSISDFQSVERDYIEDSDASPFNDFNFFLNTDAEQWSQELRLNGESDQMKWVAGLYYLGIESDDANGAEIPVFGLGGLPPVTGLDTPSTSEKDSFSVFGQVEYDLNDEFTVIGGFRWIEESVDFTYANNAVLFPRDGTIERGGNPNVLATLGTYTGKYDEGLWSAKVELDYKPTDDLLMYASWNRGVKGGGFNSPFDLSALDPTVPPQQNAVDANMLFSEEELDAFEVGFKSTLLDGLARFNVSVYYNDYKNYQAFDIIGLATNVVSAPDAKNYGFEAELFASPAEGWDLMFGVSYNDNEVTLPSGAKTKAVQTPKWNLSGLARYEWAAFNGNVAIQGDFHYRSEHYHSLTRAPAVTEDGYHVVNARLSYTTADEKWEAAIFANNLTDEEYIVQSFDLAAALGWIEEYYGRPRWIGGSINYNF